ncbi:NAD(P)-dependent oxidoreductase [Saccharobesus litoralis]|uniref:NAD(P)-dependent oxidoreductase n=1 Tax=Saccharobesus litoralis TaxID=2172099 RepID=A0A2S0VSS8_9ALTE|nr:NAD(P)-dependent oxidoreductase [Saccharobesus litoralis]AWB67243.1 NAD(P)-dependent oxidoreductase [Saccharobesus litoralis]
MANIAFLGMGAMGSRMVLHLINAGHQVTVWNRDLSMADRLKDKGAIIAKTPAQAAIGQDYVISMVRDDQASRQVWLDENNGALSTINQQTVAIESSTLSIEWTNTLAQHCQAHGVAFADAPVAGSRPQAEAGQLIYFVGSNSATFERISPILSLMASKIFQMGNISAGATVKLLVNTLFSSQIALMAELIHWLKIQNTDIDKMLNTLTELPVCSAALAGATKAIQADNYAPAFPIELVEKDLAYFLQANDKNLPITSLIHKHYENAIKQDLAHLNINAVAKLARC